MEAVLAKLVPLLFIIVPAILFICIFLILEKRRKK